MERSQNPSVAAKEIPPDLKAAILSEALPYIRRFHGRTVVIKYGGNAMLDRTFEHIVQAARSTL